MVLSQAGLGAPIVDIDYHRVHFQLEHDEPPMPITLCALCVKHNWSEEQLSALQQQCLQGWADNTSAWKGPQTFKILGAHPDYPVQTWKEIQ